ncbi:FAD/FMN-containing dehydrogenase [Pseudomassariella vexata]|uniref:FAD/FMN-containing dehydrogenase n=1 Tax=Pseudomassariella vexata TaxID=1141098 RepID=A0A1Y2E8K5_9PEZI|nr:FAD/FMN-containing dehydrogenase [Pseudomassariella vexata]ORY67654.1 FAD/FMN-containing dehydrogenase [Pseudomassariella vexata]
MLSLRQSYLLACTVLGVAAVPYNTFDGVGFPACNDVAAVYNVTSVDEMVQIVKDAAANGTPVRASGKGHMWYDTMCQDDPNTIIIHTEEANQITEFSLEEGAASGSVVMEAGVTFLQLAEYLHERNASMGYTLVNWNITMAGAVAMGAHRSSIREDSMVAAGVLSMDIINGNGDIVTLDRDNTNDDWLAASTSLGLLGVIARLKFKIYPDFKVYAQQLTLEEDDVLNGDIYNMIAPYATANFWWWPYLKKFHWRTYDVIPTNKSDQQGFQNTFSVTELEGNTARTILDSGKYLATSNMLMESIFFGQWSEPNFHEKTTDEKITDWPVYGWNYDVLIGGLYPGQQPEWDYNLHGMTLELAFPIIMANDMLKRVRELFDAEWTERGIIMTSTYRSGINIKFGKPYYDLLGQVTYDTSDGADWSKGAIMFDFPSFKPTIGDKKRFNEEFYPRLAKTLVEEFPCRPHWTKNTREVYGNATKNIDPDHLARFKVVREKFDPNGIFKSIIGEILGLYD